MGIWSYRDELESRDPARVNEAFHGGAYGCPGCYFDGAPFDDPITCRPLSDARCRDCWDKPYAQERWNPDGQ